MSPLEVQALENAWARAHEVGAPAVLGMCLKAKMPVAEARKVVEAAKDTRHPFSFANKCISRWRTSDG